ncbi:hypothetical protein CIB84_016536 [Bambusicola thoracicus]|uniref:Uncharacterized protein n=1 Tax=Bambusicola thoracicus TaxID=9083 RepID=A0A2P4S6I1_BAMTH|nr:hypothetical protein CIB84_016536 [Bambusicola thoracicus]
MLRSLRVKWGSSSSQGTWMPQKVGWMP